MGLIMIVLEAALDLKLKRRKWPIIWKSFVIAFFSLVSSSLLIAWLIQGFIQNIGFTPGIILLHVNLISSVTFFAERYIFLFPEQIFFLSL